MKMKCIGGLSNGQIIDVDHGQYREHDQIRVPVNVTYEVLTFQQDLQKLMDDTALLNPYDYYKVCCFSWQDKSKAERKLFFLCPIGWTQFEALASVIGA